MKSRIIYMLLALVLPLIATAQDFTVGGLKYYVRYNNTGVGLSQQDASQISGDIVIPSQVTYNGKTYPVVRLDHDCFRECTNLTSITMPNTITEMGYSCFFDCTNLKSAKLSNALTNINSCAFYNCSSLTEIEIPNSVTTIGEQSFAQCTSLARVIMPQKLTEFESRVFEGCTSLKSIVIPDGVTTIGANSFSETALTVTILPASVTAINGFSFSDISNSLVLLCKGTTPPTLNSYSFIRTTLSAVLVPMEAVDAYNSADVWKSFNIVGVDITGFTQMGNSSDVNADGNVDITDVNQVINTMLGK